jgi:hypothetical protein
MFDSHDAAEAASTKSTGTVHETSTGSERGAGRGTTLTSSGESSGAMRSQGSCTTASAGFPGWISASASDDVANGCGRATRSAWLNSLPSARSPPPTDTNRPWTTRTRGRPACSSLRFAAFGLHGGGGGLRVVRGTPRSAGARQDMDAARRTVGGTIAQAKPVHDLWVVRGRARITKGGQLSRSLANAVRGTGLG